MLEREREREEGNLFKICEFYTLVKLKLRLFIEWIDSNNEANAEEIRAGRWRDGAVKHF